MTSSSATIQWRSAVGSSSLCQSMPSADDSADYLLCIQLADLVQGALFKLLLLPQAALQPISAPASPFHAVSDSINVMLLTLMPVLFCCRVGRGFSCNLVCQIYCTAIKQNSLFSTKVVPSELWIALKDVKESSKYEWNLNIHIEYLDRIAKPIGRAWTSE